jgi:hypothetical protein
MLNACSRASGVECSMFDVSHRVRLKPFYAAFRPDRLITFAWHPGDVPRGIIADIVEDLGISRDDFYFRKF